MHPSFPPFSSNPFCLTHPTEQYSREVGELKESDMSLRGESYFTPLGEESGDFRNVEQVDEKNRENPSSGTAGCSSQSSLLDPPGAFLGFEAMLGGCCHEAGRMADLENLSCSDLTCHLRLFEENEGCCGIGSRKRGYSEQEDEEVESAQFNKRQRSQEELDEEVEDIICAGTCSCFPVSVVTVTGTPPDPEESFSEDDELDESELELQMLCDDFGFEMPEEEMQRFSCCSREEGEEGGELGDTMSSGSARKSRRAKIRQTVKLLRDLIPGGNCMDSGNVLDEAINYVKLLQLQVQTLVDQRRSFCPTS
ncbi:hypothetical protein R1sor_010011 [Riccia sorocarpa]|uniref:BHLH domain-containing protein n=1 Tax=Riccia sorocarpa TaxID=122646 RepID=A0ABD3I0B8_9MARC